MVNIKLIIEYEGTNYCGWQKQKNANSIQEEIEKAIWKITGDKVNLIGSGRTDRKVHARGQVANFVTKSKIPPDRFKYALNSKLPVDIRIIDSKLVDEKFHSRYDAIGKRYQYIILNRPIISPLYRNFSYHVPYPLNHRAMEEASKFFIGTHDFFSFMAANSSIKNTVRTINHISLDKRDELIFFNIEGNGFLYNMVRIIMGTLVEVGGGRLEQDNILQIINSKDRKLAGHTAPPEGLYLEKVYY